MDRVGDIARYFPLALDVGCGRSHIAMATTDDITGYLVQCDMSENAVVRTLPFLPNHLWYLTPTPGQSGPPPTTGGVPVDSLVADEEGKMPFADDSFDLVMTSLRYLTLLWSS